MIRFLPTNTAQLGGVKVSLSPGYLAALNAVLVSSGLKTARDMGLYLFFTTTTPSGEPHGQ